MDFFKLLAINSDKHAQKTALIFRDTAVTFAQLQDMSKRVCVGLSSLGISQDQKVAIYLPNVPEYIYSFLGIFCLRAVAVPLDFMLTEEEVVTFISHSDSSVLIAQEKKGVDLAVVRARCPQLKHVVLLQEGSSVEPSLAHLSWSSLVKSSIMKTVTPAIASDKAALFYTSGSTGHPKGVLLRYSHLDNPVDCVRYFINPSAKDSLLCAGVPFSHLGGLDYILFMLAFGMTLVLMERFQPLEFLKHIEKYKITIFCIVPAMYVAVL
jgi:long-chain acyl-CoA synthetase